MARSYPQTHDRGNWTVNTQYMPGDIVLFQGSAFTAIRPNLNSSPILLRDWAYLSNTLEQHQADESQRARQLAEAHNTEHRGRSAEHYGSDRWGH